MEEGKDNLIQTDRQTDRQTDECLDWQNSQFINIVGKDDVSAAIEVKRMEVA